MQQVEKTIPKELYDLADRVGDFIHNWGFKRVHGRIWTHLALAKSPLDAGELIRRLGVSKALVSMSLSDLLAYDVILETGKSTKGTTLYKVNPDVMAVITNVVRQREKRLVSRISETHEALKNVQAELLKVADIDPRGMKSMGTLVMGASTAIEMFLSKCSFDMGVGPEFRMAHEP
jgi:DNA-binding transcriptional regulator GbsR (MarR family)